MVTTPLKTQTLQEFLQQPDINDSPAWELIEGEKQQKIMGGGKHSLLTKRLVSIIDNAENDYEAFPELRCSFGNRSLVPDISILPSDRIPVDKNQEIIATGIEFAPTWVIEILSPKQYQTRVTDNLLHCLRHGTKLAWLIDPQTRSILAYWPDRLPEIYRGDGNIPLLSPINLELSPEQIFNWLRRDRNTPTPQTQLF